MNYIVEPFSVRLKKAMNRLNISVDYLSKIGRASCRERVFRAV